MTLPVRAIAALVSLALLGGCDGVQSVLSPGGRDAQVIATLFWWMLGGAVILWLLMNGLLVYVTRIDQRAMSQRTAEALIIGGGIVFPTVVLAGLLAFALSEMPRQRDPGTGLTVRVTGESWWWRVEYLKDGATAAVVSANEIRLPAHQRSEITLNAHRVIHSFWIPALGGKTDMIPGRETRMSLEPTRAGEFRGQCTEFCGESHALMAFGAVVMEPEAFDAWLAKEAEPAAPPEGEAARRGQAIFNAEGCGACHAIRGTAATGRVGPDLTHLGGRVSLAAGILPMTEDALIRWIRDPEAVKPGARMPAYDHLGDGDLAALAAYLEGLT
ncbi:cytochrome c oxidase subunit II [Roseivivax sediminis]|uniref:Cytochrome aa3 subunit 2 n=1 Tax=Roseivivax sediminis TaxID=936889 RepID=A0A1I1V8X7_9RHOB|nr:cytochrome c oxidase subunit II [Roseivivax sediminis]SFD79447.1 cytochrome c oxidase subunit 2 [Roseivivax sediminis]